MHCLNIFLVLLSVISVIYGHKILFYSPKFGKSHVTFIGKIADILAKDGHEIVCLFLKI